MYIAPVADFNAYKRKKMKKYLTIGSVVGLGVGFIGGMYAQYKYDDQRMQKAIPLINNALENVLNKVLFENVPEEELKKVMKSELDFLNIAMRSKTQNLH